jgi:hypothetical protein
LGQFSLIVDDWAGLAHLALAQGNLDQALEQVEDILAWIEANGVEGVEYLLQVYLTCYRILKAKARKDLSFEERAHTVLDAAHNALMERVSSIQDEALKIKYLENVETNREIVALWQAKESQATRSGPDSEPTP